MNEQMVEQANEIDIFNSGCDLVLSHVENFILKLEESGESVDMKYDKIIRMVAGMRAVVDKRRAPKQEEPAIMVPEQQIIIPN